MALTRLPSFTLLNTDSYTFGNANVTGNITTGNLKTDHLLYANGDPYAFTTNAAGTNTQVQFNDGNSFAGSANLTFNKTTGTLTSDFFVGNGSQLTGLPAGYTDANANSAIDARVTKTFVDNLSVVANIANIAYSISGSNVSGQVSNSLVAGTVYTNAQPNITSLGALVNLSVAGNLDTDGNAHIGGNLTVIGSIEFTGNGTINQITGNSGQFFGDAQGVGALYAGLATGYAEVYNPIVQASADANDYVQINFQNINHGTDSSTDFCATSDNGTDTKFFIDMGIAGGSWDGTQDNSLGNALSADDGYLYVQGDTNVGNLILGTSSTGTNIKFIAGGTGSGNIRAVINSTGLNVAGTITGVNAHFTGSNISLGNASHIKIDGGASGQLLQTDGLGNVNWVTPTGTTITVDNFTANGVQTEFTLSVTPTSEAYTMVAMAGTLQPRSIYSLSGNVITFSSAPPNTAPIEITTFSSVMGFGTSDIVANSFTANTLTANTLSGNIVSSNANLSVNTLSANSITNTGTGIPTINSATSINFTASTVVRTTSSPFQFYNCTSTVRDTIAASNGYVIYNTTTNKLQVYANGTWVDLH